MDPIDLIYISSNLIMYKKIDIFDRLNLIIKFNISKWINLLNNLKNI